MMCHMSGGARLLAPGSWDRGRVRHQLQELHRQVTAGTFCWTVFVAARSRTQQAWQLCDGSGARGVT